MALPLEDLKQRLIDTWASIMVYPNTQPGSA